MELAFVFGLLGNIVSFMVYLAPIPTFYGIYKKKSAEGFQSVPYVVGLFSSMLWIYYAFLKPNTTLLVTINSAGCFFQTIYICFYLVHAPKKARIDTAKMLVLLIVLGFSLIVLLTQLLSKSKSHAASIVGWICLVFSFCVFVAPLAIVRRVVRTKSVEYMPFLLSFFLTLSAVMWFFYGLLLKDYNIALPNILGFGFGMLQMVLYLLYKNAKKSIKPILPEIKKESIALEEHKLAEQKDQIINVVKFSATVPSEIVPVVPALPNENRRDNDIDHMSFPQQTPESSN